MFGRKKKSEEPVMPVPEVKQETVEQPVRKGYTPPKSAPTPKRKQQEAANFRPLIHDDRKVARQQQRAAIAEERQKMRIAMETGDERHLPLRDKGPQRRFARDYVDARTGIGEWLMALVLVFLVMTFIQSPAIQLAVTYGMFALVIIVILEGFWVGAQLKKQLVAKFGELEPGVRWYGAMRAMQLRRLRLPKPMVRRGEYPS